MPSAPRPQGAGDERVEALVLGPLVGEQLVGEEATELVGGQQRGPAVVAPECVGDRADALQLGTQRQVLHAEVVSELGVAPGWCTAAGRTAESAKRVDDHDDVDAFLQQGSPCRGDQPDGGEAHRGQRQAHAGDDALDGDALGAPGDDDAVAEAIETVDGDHHVGGRRRGRGTSCAQSDPDVGRGEGRGVVHAVAHHDRRPPAPLQRHGVELVGGRALGQHLVDTDHGAHGLGDVGPIAGHHHHPVDALAPQISDRPRGVEPDRVLEQQGTPPARRRCRRRR